MDEATLNNLRKKYLELGECTEEDIKIKVVRQLFEDLGYEEKWFRYEYPIIRNKKITDITFIKEDKIFMIVEVKNNNLKGLKDNDLFQLIDYLSIRNIEWGILTNGKDYLLVNNKIEAEYKDKVILSFNLLDQIQTPILLYYSYRSIYIDKITYYYKYLAKFKAYKLEENDNYNTYITFRHTIEKYFEFLITKYGFREIAHLNEKDFKNFILKNIEDSKRSNKQISSKITIINKYRHINGFYELFLKHSNEVPKNPFRYLTEEQMLEGLGYKEKGNILIDFNENIANQVIEYFDNHTNEPERNKLIFLLCLFAGLSRDDIRFIKIDDFDDNMSILLLSDRKIPLPNQLYKRIKNYIDNVRDKNARVNYIFFSNYGDYSGQPLEKNTINTVIRNAVKSINNESDKELNINPETIRKLLIRKFFDVGFALEEIITILDIDIKRIGEFISTEEIIERTNLVNLCVRHPYKKFFE